MLFFLWLRKIGNLNFYNFIEFLQKQHAVLLTETPLKFGEIYLRRRLGAWWFLIKFHEGGCEMWISWRVLLYCNAFRKSVLVFIYNHLTHLLAWRISLQAKKRPQKRCYITSNPSTNLFTPLASATRRTMGQDRPKCKETISHSECHLFWFFWF